MGGQSVGGRWECVEADLPTALGGGKKLVVMSLRKQIKERMSSQVRTVRDNKQTQTVDSEQEVELLDDHWP